MVGTRRRKKLVILTVAATTLVVATVLVLLIVPIEQENSGYTLIGLTLYSFEAENVFGPTWSNFTYRGVAFGFHVFCAFSGGGGELCGNVTESSGVTFAFSIWQTPPGPGPGPWLTWVAPDSQAAIQFASNSNGLTHLLVAV